MLGLFVSPALAQDIGKYAKVAPAGNWVKANQPPTEPLKEAKDRDAYFPLVDWQYRITASERDSYARYVETLNTPAGVEENSTVTINFDPQYQSVTLHHLRVIRGGDIIDRLELSEFDIYRRETDRKKLIFNGDLQLAYIVPDVRPGDTLDYAYTRHGKNPATGPHFFLQFQQKYDDVTVKFSHRVLVHKDVPVFTKSIASALEPKLGVSGAYRSYEWDLKGETPTPADSNRPNWHFAWPTYHIGSYETWADVGKYFARHYEIPNPLPANVAAVAEDISRKYETPELRLRAALAYVQKDIRYLGIELGAGGYIPRDPERVLDRRFGDCKDMTLLLVSLLEGLGIQAAPLLVDLDLKGGVALWLPTHTAFDHIVVRAVIGEKVYILDATKGEQLGDLDHLQQGVFEKGVDVAFESAGLIDAHVPSPEFFEDFRDEFDVVAEPDVITFSSTSTYSMFRADSMKSWVQSSGMDHVQKSFLEFYQDSYPDIEQVGEMQVVSDEALGTITLSVDYRILNPWDIDEKNARKTFTALSREIDSELPEFDGAKRKHPYKMTHPVRSRQTLVFKLGEDWALEDEDISVDNDAFSYRKTANQKGKVYTEVYHVTSKADHIAAAAFNETMAEIESIDDALGIELFMSIDSASSGDAAGLLKGAFAILWLSGLLIWLGVFIGRKF